MPGGCVQPSLTPRTNQAATILLDRLGIGVITPTESGCCGALSHHLSFEERALDRARANIDLWWPHIENGAEGIIITASGCAVMVKEYGHLLRNDPRYAERAARAADLVSDLSRFVAGGMDAIGISPRPGPVAFHAPCTYQHGLRLTGKVEQMLAEFGYQVIAVTDAHLCCGSAGTYSVLQPVLSRQLLNDKLNHLMAGQPGVIATANVGCQTHLASRASVPVLHWAELLVEDLSPRPASQIN